MIQSFSGLYDTMVAATDAAWREFQAYLWLQFGIDTIAPIMFAMACAFGAWLVFSSQTKGPR